jgi:hypothetical protein
MEVIESLKLHADLLSFVNAQLAVNGICVSRAEKEAFGLQVMQERTFCL